MSATTVTPTAATSPPSARTVQASVPVRDALTQIAVMAWRALVKMRRNPEQLVDVTAMPVLFTLMFGFMFAGAISGSQASYLPILIPGIIALTTITACVAAGVQLREDMDKGVFDRFRSLPIARIAPLAGPMAGRPRPLRHRRQRHPPRRPAHGLPPRRRPSRRTLAIVLAVITGWSLAWIFMWLGTVTRTAGAVQGMSMMIMFPLAFLSNAFVPVSTLPAWLRTVTTVNPVSHVVSAMRDLMNKDAITSNVSWALLGCAAVVAIFLPLAVRSYARGPASLRRTAAITARGAGQPYRPAAHGPGAALLRRSQRGRRGRAARHLGRDSQEHVLARHRALAWLSRPGRPLHHDRQHAVKGLTMTATDEDIIRDLLHRYASDVRPPASIATGVAARQRRRDRLRVVSLAATGAALGTAAGVLAVVPGHSSPAPSGPGPARSCR